MRRNGNSMEMHATFWSFVPRGRETVKRRHRLLANVAAQPLEFSNACPPGCRSPFLLSYSPWLLITAGSESEKSGGRWNEAEGKWRARKSIEERIEVDSVADEWEGLRTARMADITPPGGNSYRVFRAGWATRSETRSGWRK